MTKRRTDSRRQQPTSQAQVWGERMWPTVSRYMPLWLAMATMVVYVFTMAPRLTWAHAGRDGGDLITAAVFLGVPHPPGYPTYTMLASLFAQLPFGSVAWRVHLFSAVAGSAAVALLYLVGLRLVPERGSRWAVLGSAVGALLLGFSPLFWGHSLIAEVYTLHLFFIALVLWLMLRWRDGDGHLAWAALAFGIGMGNHITLIMLAPLILLLLVAGRDRLSWRGVMASVVALAAGLLVYLYLPWRAATDPIVNWGYPDTWDGFWWMISGEGYRRFFFALPMDELGARLEDWWQLIGDQFPFVAWPLAVLGLWALIRRDRWFALGSFLVALISLVYAIGYDTTDAFVNLMPVFFFVALWMGLGAVFFLTELQKMHEPRGRPSLVARVLTIAVLLLPLISLVEEWSGMDLTHDRDAEIFAMEALETAEPGAMLVPGSDAHTFALWYYRYVEGIRPDVPIVNYAMLGFDWYQRTIESHHPDVIVPGQDGSGVTKLSTVLANLDQRSIYITEDEDELPGLEITQLRDWLWQVTAP